MTHVDNPLAYQIVASSADPVLLNRYRPFGDLVIRRGASSTPSPIVSPRRIVRSGATGLLDRFSAVLHAVDVRRSTEPVPCC